MFNVSSDSLQDKTTLVNFLAILKWVAAFVVSIWARVSTTVHLLCGLMAIDMFSGFISAALLHRVSARVHFAGLARKIMTLVLVYVGHVITVPLNLGFDLGEMIALAYVVNEVISIVENCVEIGVPIPPVLVQTLGKFRKVVPAAPIASVTTILRTEEVTVIPPAHHNNKDTEEQKLQ